jgi:hypothetical protein
VVSDQEVALEHPILQGLEAIVRSWPGATSEMTINRYKHNTVTLLEARFPPLPSSTACIDIVGVAGEKAGDGFEIHLSSRETGEVVWFENWERSMSYFPDGTRIRSTTDFAEFGCSRIRQLLHSEWKLEVRSGLIFARKTLFRKMEHGWQVDERKTWFGSRLVSGYRHRVYLHSPC